MSHRLLLCQQFVHPTPPHAASYRGVSAMGTAAGQSLTLPTSPGWGLAHSSCSANRCIDREVHPRGSQGPGSEPATPHHTQQPWEARKPASRGLGSLLLRFHESTLCVVLTGLPIFLGTVTLDDPLIIPCTMHLVLFHGWETLNRTSYMLGTGVDGWH